MSSNRTETPSTGGADEDSEADLDVEWSGAVAKGASIDFVTCASTYSTDGIDLSSQYIVDNSLALNTSIMSLSFVACERDLGLTGNSFYKTLWAQAASEGITVFVASGDSGAYACMDANGAPLMPRAVNGVASTPYNTAVGGTQFDKFDSGPLYWSASNSAYYSSALRYIPEAAWNEGCDSTPDSPCWASGGGASSQYNKPEWQTCRGVPADGHRDLRDVSLNADSNIGYLVYTPCLDPACLSNNASG